MPVRIDRDEALARIAEVAPGGCVPCALVESSDLLAESTHAVAVLSRFPVRWGHVLVVLRDHVTSMAETSPEVFADAAALAHAAAVAVERALSPRRCYVASLGTDDPPLPMTFPHLHFHVIPIPEAGARPAQVLTWQTGVYAAEPHEWAELTEEWDKFLSRAEFDKSADEVGEAARQLGLKMKAAYDRMKKADD